jgi:hypothetical protein
MAMATAVRTYAAFGDIGTTVQELGRKMPVLLWRAAPKARRLVGALRDGAADRGERRRAEGKRDP